MSSGGLAEAITDDIGVRAQRLVRWRWADASCHHLFSYSGRSGPEIIASEIEQCIAKTPNRPVTIKNAAGEESRHSTAQEALSWLRVLSQCHPTKSIEPHAPQHFFICVHGVEGSSHDWKMWADAFAERRRPDWHFRPAVSITPGSSAQGGMGTGLRELAALLKNEVIGWVEDFFTIYVDCPQLTLHFIGHSMGGITARAALPLILEKLSRETRVAYGHFFTLNTPHLGINGLALTGLTSHLAKSIYTPWETWVRDLTLRDGIGGELPLLVDLSQPGSDGYRALGRFAFHTVVAATHWDMMVTFCTGAICAENPFQAPDPCERPFWRIDAAVGYGAERAITKRVACEAASTVQGRTESTAAAEYQESLVVLTPPLASAYPHSPPTIPVLVRQRHQGRRASFLLSATKALCREVGRERQDGWITSGDALSVFPEEMLQNLAGAASWRRIAYTLHLHLTPNVHTFAIGQSVRGAEWAMDFVRLLVETLAEDI